MSETKHMPPSLSEAFLGFANQLRDGVDPTDVAGHIEMFSRHMKPEYNAAPETAAERDRLREENERLRTALEKIANFDRDISGGGAMQAIAISVLAALTPKD